MPEPERDDSDDSESGAMLPGPGVSERRVQDPGRSAPSQGTRCRLRQQSSRLLIPVMPVMLTGALLRIKCCHAGTSCGRHCPDLLGRLRNVENVKMSKGTYHKFHLLCTQSGQCLVDSGGGCVCRDCTTGRR